MRRLLSCLVACILFLKVLWLNDSNCTLREDPLELWIAIGIAVLLIIPTKVIVANEPDKSSKSKWN